MTKTTKKYPRKPVKIAIHEIEYDILNLLLEVGSRQLRRIKKIASAETMAATTRKMPINDAEVFFNSSVLTLYPNRSVINENRIINRTRDFTRVDIFITHSGKGRFKSFYAG